MIDATCTLIRNEHGELELARLLERLTEQLLSGEPVDLDALATEHPHHAERLAELLPTIRAVAEVGRAANPLESKLQLAGPEGDGFAEQFADRTNNRTLGDFLIQREIGRGGMGVVYEAEQLSLGRRVALKVLPFAGVLDERQLKRFKLEAAAAAALKHPNIVSVHCVGCERGVHFYAMEYVEGQTLAAAISGCRENVAGTTRVPSSPTERTDEKTATDTLAAALSTLHTEKPRDFFRRVAELGIQAAEALYHAHDMGIIHRDIKPANLLLDHAGKLYITDFGLARLSTDAGMTLTGDMLGTLRYMSPEQASGAKLLDERTDIYSLGVTLYELLALRPAFPDNDRQKLIRQVAEQEPPRLRAINPRIPADLETVIFKAMSKESVERYTTARELAADLAQFLADKPIRARRPPPLARLHRWGRRHVAAVLSLVIVLAVSLTALGVVLALVTDEQQKTADALTQAQDNLEVATDAVDKLYTNFAIEWLANETAPSNLQQQFLEQAADFYRRIVERPAQTPHDLITQAGAYQRIGELEKYLENYEEALLPLKESLNIARPLRDEFATEAAYREALATPLLSLGAVYRELQDFAKAEAADREALDLLQSLPESKANADRLVACKLEYAHVMQHQGKFDEALRLVQDIRDQLIRETPPNTYFPLSLITCRYRIASILLDQNQLTEARQENEKGLGHCQGIRAKAYQDARSFLQNEIQLVVQTADIAAQQGELEEAIAHYRNSLALQRQSLKAQRTPEDFVNAKFAADVSTEPEPGPFCRYVETQLKLADALRRSGRPYEAEQELGSCELVTRVLRDIARPRVLRYRVLQANVWAMAAQLSSAEERPDDAQILRRIAARLWLNALQEFPNANVYVSGTHNRQRDLEWFQETFPGDVAENAATVREGNNFRDTPFVRRAAAMYSFRRQQWSAALRCFEQTAKPNKQDHAYDWLHIAMAHAHLSHAVHAKNYYDASAARIDKLETPPAELVQLRDQAKQLVDTLPLPDSYYKFDRVLIKPDASGLAFAHHIRVGPDGKIYVASHEADVVTVFDGDTGAWVRDLATSGGELDGPWGMIFGPDDRLYVSGHWSRNIVRFDVTTGEYNVFVPSASGGLGVGKGLAFGPDRNLYVTSRVDDNVKRYNGATGAYMGDFITAGSGGLEGVTGVAFGPDGNLYVASASTGAINVYDGTTGKFLKAFISGLAPGLARPLVLEFRDDGFLYVACQRSHEIRRFNAKTGGFVNLVVPSGVESSNLQGLDGFAFDRQGRLYVSIGTAREPSERGVLRYMTSRSAAQH
ncbi:MAG: protein kinase [Pirellulales bacterium]